MTLYAEMAVRTATGRAAVQAHVDRLTAAGVHLVIVSNAPHDARCAGLERPRTGDGRRSGPAAGPRRARQPQRGQRAHARGRDVDEARAAGLQHPTAATTSAPTCPVSPGSGRALAGPDGYEASQRQRAIERGIRRWKHRSAAAMTPEAKKAANAKARAWKAKMREHLAEHPELLRRRHREQIGAGNLCRPPPELPSRTRPAGPLACPPGGRPHGRRRTRNGRTPSAPAFRHPLARRPP